ncbi:Uncharacterised protein [BD1-7 clade bacterium]|uniref:DUF58 domain-containing protein n=1 Tax=BD1-7 clade bacterium TaxID=2029982 RepID=A0A5S9PQ61_9GAMM|nr:Uncharacterised protein [BD1-7 clade bacterium]
MTSTLPVDEAPAPLRRAPSHRVIQLLALWAVLAMCGGLWRMFSPAAGTLAVQLGLLISVFLLFALLWDFRRANQRLVHAQRQLPESFAIGNRQPVTLTLGNELAEGSTRELTLEIFDHTPDSMTIEESMPIQFSMEAGRSYQLLYHGQFHQRGLAEFGDLDVRYLSPWKLWDVQQSIALPQAVKVYPDFMSIAWLDALHDDEQHMLLGLNRLQRRGEGMSFRQLREYRDGDNIRHIDWKASSRQQKMITREFEDERDQQIVYLLDCGRRMRSQDDALSHFDHALNAMLISASVALKHGDAVGMMGFATDEQRYFRPAKGHSQLNALLNYAYDIQCTQNTADYLAVTTELALRQKKRALVILITNLHDESADELLAAVAYLKRNHQVMVACMREAVVSRHLANPVEQSTDAFLYLGSLSYMQRRQALIDKLQNQGVFIVDAEPDQLHLGLVQHYLALKRQGVI